MTFALAVPQILEHVDVTRWGKRKSELLRLVAVLQEGPNLVPLGRKLLVATGRSARQAKYDHDVLVGLHHDRVLTRARGAGRLPDCWGINDLNRWRGIPWLSSRREVMAAFSSPLPDAAVALWAERAGRAVGLGTVTPIIEALADAGLSVNLLPTTPRHLSTTPQAPLDPGPPTVHYGTPGADSLNAFEVLRTSSSSLRPNQEEEEEDSGQGKAGQQLRARVETKLGKPVFGSPALELDRLAFEHAGELDRLLRLVDGAGGIMYPAGMIQYLRARIVEPEPVVTRPAGHPRDCPICEGQGTVIVEEGPHVFARRCDGVEVPTESLPVP